VVAVVVVVHGLQTSFFQALLEMVELAAVVSVAVVREGSVLLLLEQ
jgi:hypothetical protein